MGLLRRIAVLCWSHRIGLNGTYIHTKPRSPGERGLQQSETRMEHTGLEGFHEPDEACRRHVSQIVRAERTMPALQVVQD